MDEDRLVTQPVTPLVALCMSASPEPASCMLHMRRVSLVRPKVPPELPDAPGQGPGHGDATPAASQVCDADLLQVSGAEFTITGDTGVTADLEAMHARCSSLGLTEMGLSIGRGVEPASRVMQPSAGKPARGDCGSSQTGCSAPTRFALCT